MAPKLAAVSSRPRNVFFKVLLSMVVTGSNLGNPRCCIDEMYGLTRKLDEMTIVCPLLSVNYIMNIRSCIPGLDFMLAGIACYFSASAQLRAELPGGGLSRYDLFYAGEAKTRNMPLLRATGGLSQRDVSCKLRISVGTVEKHITKALAIFREELYE
jgi:hypothetical protein